MLRQANPLAAHLDATVAAQHAGVGDADVVLLQEIGEDIAAFALSLFEKMSRLTTAGAMGTSTQLPAEQHGHPKAAFVAPDPAGMVDLLLQTFEEDGYGYALDAVDVIASAARLRLDRSAERRATESLPVEDLIVAVGAAEVGSRDAYPVLRASPALLLPSDRNSSAMAS